MRQRMVPASWTDEKSEPSCRFAFLLGLCRPRGRDLSLMAFEVDRVESEMFDDSVFVTLQIASLDEFQQVSVGYQFAVFTQFPLDRLEKIAGLFLDEIQHWVDDVLKLRDDAVARDFHRASYGNGAR